MSILQLEEPEKKTIRQLMDLAETELGIPDFQRDFVWSRQDIADLFESIVRGYYIGSLLFWTNGRAADLGSTPIYGIKHSDGFSPKSLVLDGQQRISSLYYAIHSPPETLWNTKAPYYFFIDLQALLKLLNEGDSDNLQIIVSYSKDIVQEEELENQSVLFRRWLFPLSDLPRLHDWLDDFEIFLEVDESNGLSKAREIKRAPRERLSYVWESFHIPVIKLPEAMELDNVAKVFEKLNSTGVTLTVFDLLNARLIKHHIKLRSELYDEALDKFEKLAQFAESNQRFPVHVIQTVALLRGKPCQKKDLLSLEPKSFESDWKQSCNYFNEALEKASNLRDGFGILSPKWVPYSPMLPVLAVLLKKAESYNDKARCYEKIESWYWSSIVKAAYESATETRMSADVRDVTSWFGDDNEVPGTVSSAREVKIIDLKDAVTTSNALYKAVICLTALKGARDFNTNQMLELNTLDDHHIFPKSKAKIMKVEDEINSVLNKTLIDKETNRRYIKSNMPSEYLKRLMRDYNLTRNDLQKRFESHLIYKKAFEYLENDDFDGFIKARQNDISKEFLRRIGNQSD